MSHEVKLIKQDSQGVAAFNELQLSCSFKPAVLAEGVLMPDSAAIAVVKADDAISEPNGEHLLLSKIAVNVNAFASVLGDINLVMVQFCDDH